MPDKKQWIVITSGEEPLDEVSKRVEAKGFVIESKLEAIGQIVGSGTDETKNAVMKLKGVADVQPSFDVNIGPPDAEIS